MSLGNLANLTAVVYHFHSKVNSFLEVLLHTCEGMFLFVYNTGELWQSSQIDDIAHATVFSHLFLNSSFNKVYFETKWETPLPSLQSTLNSLGQLTFELRSLNV